MVSKLNNKELGAEVIEIVTQIRSLSKNKNLIISKIPLSQTIENKLTPETLKPNPEKEKLEDMIQK